MLMKQRIMALNTASQTHLVRISNALGRLRAERSGQGLVEYALILALIAILVIVALKFLQPQVSNTLNRVSNNL
jgi:pilus assembly protein Flp/PilA